MGAKENSVEYWCIKLNAGTTMFKKLKNKFTTAQIEVGECTIVYDQGHSYYNVGATGLEEFYAVIPERFRNKFSVRYFTVTRNIIPHHDSGARSAINFYFSTQGAIGTYYVPNVETSNTTRVGKDGALYDPSQLDVGGTYVAEDFDVYLLDVKKPHAVTFTKFPAFRSALALQTNDFSFEEVYAMLVETGNL